MISNQITEISNPELFPLLQKLIISKNKISNIDQLSEFHNLKVFVADFNAIQEIDFDRFPKGITEVYLGNFTI